MENIKTNLLDTASYLYDEAKSLMRQELRTPSVYNGIVEAIALGATKPNEVASATGAGLKSKSNAVPSIRRLASSSELTVRMVISTVSPVNASSGTVMVAFSAT